MRSERQLQTACYMLFQNVCNASFIACQIHVLFVGATPCLYSWLLQNLATAPCLAPVWALGQLELLTWGVGRVLMLEQSSTDPQLLGCQHHRTAPASSSHILLHLGYIEFKTWSWTQVNRAKLLRADQFAPGEQGLC